MFKIRNRKQPELDPYALPSDIPPSVARITPKQGSRIWDVQWFKEGLDLAIEQERRITERKKKYAESLEPFKMKSVELQQQVDKLKIQLANPTTLPSQRLDTKFQIDRLMAEIDSNRLAADRVIEKLNEEQRQK